MYVDDVDFAPVMAEQCFGHAALHYLVTALGGVDRELAHPCTQRTPGCEDGRPHHAVAPGIEYARTEIGF